ncbi:MAG: hypothetical protein ACLFTD_04590 [Halochromatium sp.]
MRAPLPERTPVVMRWQADSNSAIVPAAASTTCCLGFLFQVTYDERLAEDVYAFILQQALAQFQTLAREAES